MDQSQCSPWLKRNKFTKTIYNHFLFFDLSKISEISKIYVESWKNKKKTLKKILKKIFYENWTEIERKMFWNAKWKFFFLRFTAILFFTCYFFFFADVTSKPDCISFAWFFALFSFFSQFFSFFSFRASACRAWAACWLGVWFCGWGAWLGTARTLNVYMRARNDAERYVREYV